MNDSISEKDLRTALMVCARAISSHKNGHMLIPTFERIEAELQRIENNNAVKSRAEAMLRCDYKGTDRYDRFVGQCFTSAGHDIAEWLAS